MTVKPWMLGAVLVLLIGAWMTGCLRERSRQDRARELALLRQDSTLARLRVDSARLEGERTQAAREVAEAQAARDALAAKVKARDQQLAAVRRRSDSLLGEIGSAATVGDSLARALHTITSLIAERGALDSVRLELVAVVVADSVSYTKLKALQVSDSTGRMNAEARAASLAKTNAGLQVKVGELQRKARFNLALGGTGTVIVAGGFYVGCRLLGGCR